ncbi:MAG: LuxR C-terminal-related transcriptional regulator [Thermomicrobia bacterium]|nr:LuxR C-terminal-related transcriptional regulator [Thermomicrobia bacterium]
MDTKRTMARIQREVVQLCYAGHEARALRTEVFRRLRALIPFDAYWCTTADPATLLPTGAVTEDLPAPLIPAIIANEYRADDVNKFTQLARSRRPVNTLFDAAHGRPETSVRYRDILAPMGFGNEVRAVLRADGVCWGLMCLHRERHARGFTATEIATLAQIAPHLAVGLRTALLHDDLAVAPRDDGPGLVLLGTDLTIAALSPTAERLLTDLDDWPHSGDVPQAVRAVAHRLEALAHADDDRALLPRVRVRARSGQWLALHASRLAGPRAAGQIAVTIEPARPIEVAPLILAAYNLTERETQVAQLVLQGRATDEVVNELAISALTVQQHLKAIFDKVGVRSRRELVAQVFAQRYWPQVQTGTRIAANGFFASQNADR